MNAIGIALIWCIVQITLLGVLAAGLYLLVRRLRPAAAAPVVFSSLAIVVILSVLAFSPWPRWTSDRAAPLPDAVASKNSPRPLGEGLGVRASDPRLPTGERWGEKASNSPRPTNLRPVPGKGPGVRALPSAINPRDAKAVETVKAEPVAHETPPSSAAMLWRTLMAELSNAQADDTWRWPSFVGVVLLAAMSCGVGWLILGMAAVRWQRRRSQPVFDAELLELIDVLRAELGCRRAVEVRESGDLATAATIGWRRPVLLLPADWRSWTPEQRRAVLAHEIVHARSHDFVALLFGQLGLMLHCYHPLLHWLMNRLRLEQELAADAAAASVSGGPRQYLSTIAEIALLTEDRRLSWPTRTFLPTRTTFLRRIATLRGSQVRFDRISPAGRLTMVGMVLLFGVLVAGLRAPAQSSQAVAGDTPTAPTTAKPVASTAPTAAKPVAVPALPQDGVKLQYGYKKGERYYYNVKIAATLPDEDTTHDGVLVYGVLSSTDEQFTLKCTGSLFAISKPKADASPRMMGPRIAAPPGRFGRPRIPGPPHFFGPGAEPIRPEETAFDRQGKIVRHGESPSLPFLLGKQAELVVEQLPGDARPAWNTEREIAVIERSESSGPPFFGPFGSAGSETNRGAKERIDYAVIGQDRDSIRISKKYSLKTLAEQGVTHIDMSGSGELVFDKRSGVIKSQNMKYEVRVNEKNVAVTIPMSLDCRLMTDDERTQQKKREAEATRMQEEWLAKIRAEHAAKAKAGQAAGAADPPMRTWHAATGNYRVRAAFVALEADSVALKKADGRTIKVPLEKLSKADQEYAKRHAQAVKGKSEDPFQ